MSVTACPLCGRDTDESRRCFDCRTSACGTCDGSTGGPMAQVCDACCRKAKGLPPGIGPGPAAKVVRVQTHASHEPAIPKRRPRPAGKTGKQEGQELINEYRPGLFGGTQ